MTSQGARGRTNQKLRTRTAIVRAAAELSRTGRGVTMREVARAAMVCEATAYRYFPDLAGLLQEAIAGQLPTADEALASVADCQDPVERVAVAAESLLRHVLARQGVVRAMIAATVLRPGRAAVRPGLRLGLIEHALSPWEQSLGEADPAVLAQLKRDLVVVVSAEALFGLIDLHGLEPEAAVASIVRTARTLALAAVRDLPCGAVEPVGWSGDPMSAPRVGRPEHRAGSSRRAPGERVNPA
jgi:AcrR family transcriptional regulator